jgi:hypothetical protein
MSQFLVRILVGAFGGICVAGLLYLWFRSRRQKREDKAAVASESGSSDRPAKQPGALQSIVVSVVATVISGILMSYIPQILSPEPSPAIDSPSPTPQIVSIDDSDADPKEPAIPAVLPEDTPSVEIEDPAPIPIVDPVLPEPPDVDNEEEMELSVPVPDLDVLLSDGTTEWNTKLDAPIEFEPVVSTDGKLLISGTSTTSVLSLSSAAAMEVSEIPPPRIRIDSAGTSVVLPLATPPISDLPMELHLLIEGAETMMMIKLKEPEPIEHEFAQSRLLIERAAITELIELSNPDMSHGDS